MRDLLVGSGDEIAAGQRREVADDRGLEVALGFMSILSLPLLAPTQRANQRAPRAESVPMASVGSRRAVPLPFCVRPFTTSVVI